MDKQLVRYHTMPVLSNFYFITCTQFFTRAVLRLVWPSILLQSAGDRVATATETVTASRVRSAMSVKQRK